MRIEKKITEACNYGDGRNTNDIQYIVLLSLDDKPTPHYHINEGKAFQVIPDNNMSAAVNGPRMSKYGIYHGICTKYNSISIGTTNSHKDKETCLHLIMTLMQRYDVAPDNVLRIKDVTGEVGPNVWDDDEKWESDVIDRLRNILKN